MNKTRNMKKTHRTDDDFKKTLAHELEIRYPYINLHASYNVIEAEEPRSNTKSNSNIINSIEHKKDHFIKVKNAINKNMV